MRRTILMLALATPLLFACSADADGDGVAANEDCNDNDADVSPEATEVCDGKDNDCDDEIDEGVLNTFYVDQDRDGYGDPDSPVQGCELALGQSDNADDCDDDEDDAYPGNDEICLDGIDNDCSGEADDDGAVDATTWYADADGDGFGVDENSRQACDPGEGWAPDGGDCNDADADVNPGADEICTDDIDNDCKDGVNDPGAIDAARWFEDADADTFGNPDSSQRACLQPEGWVTNDADCDDRDRTEKPGVNWYTDGDTDGYGLTGSAANACERAESTDADNDGDCDDENPDINPGIAEVWYDDIDSDCSGGSDYDQDGDGYDSAAEGAGDDCDDVNPGISPMATEIGDGIDNNCDGLCDEGYISRGDLIITEIMQNPAQVDDTVGEYFEVYNDSSADIVMCGGWELADSDGDSYTISGGPYTIISGDWFVFGAESDVTKNGGVPVDYEYSQPDFVLFNGADEIIISFDGATIDRLDFDGGIDWPDPSGASMNLDPDSRDEVDNDDGANWCVTDSTSMTGGDLGTPGKANEECPEET